MRCEEIGVSVSRTEFVNFLNSIHPGQFFFVGGYVNADGEKADHWLRYGIKYGNIKERDVKVLRETLSGKAMPPLKVTHGVWIPPARLVGGAVFASTGEHLVRATIRRKATIGGVEADVTEEGLVDLLDVETFSNRKGNKKDGYNVQATISYELPSSHPLIVAAIGDADLQGTVLQGLLAPRETTTEYTKEGQSCYSMPQEGQPARWYIRDVLRVSKVVRVPGQYDFTASLPINAVKKAIQSQWMLTGLYRQFILTDGQFESITIQGQAILVDGIDEKFYFALPETVKETIHEEAAVQGA